MKNIVLIGMSGVGKSINGNYLANYLRWNYIDTDQIIANRYNMPIDSIFSEYGEDYFRTEEAKTIREVSVLDDSIISTGGGVVLNDGNIERLKINGIVFLLRAKIETLVENLSKSSEIRPLLKDSKDLADSLENQYRQREKSYLIASDFIIDTDNRSTEEIGRQILMEYYRVNNLFSSCGK